MMVFFVAVKLCADSPILESSGNTLVSSSVSLGSTPGVSGNIGIAEAGSNTANASTLTLPEVLVTAPAFRLAPNSSLTASILTHDQMAPYAPRTLGEALAPVAGVDVSSYGGAGAAELLSLRGSNSDQVLVLKDGQRLNTAQGGGVDLSTIPLDQVERVEVIRGIAPSRYGVEGLGGIVNIVTAKRLQDEQTSFNLEGATGSFGTYKANGQITTDFGADGRSFLNFSGGYSQSAGGYSFVDPITGDTLNRENTDFTGENAGARLNLPSDAHWNHLFSWNWFSQDGGSPGSIYFPTPNARINEDKNSFQYQSDYTGLFPDDPFSKVTLNLGALLQNFHYTDQGLNNTFEDDSHDDQTYEARMDGRSSLSDTCLFDPSVGFRADHLNSTTDGIRDNRVGYVALEGTWLINRFKGVEPNQDFAAEWAVTPGVRGEVSSLYDPFLAPRLGLLWTWDRADSLALKANAGQLVRYPSFDDLFFPLTGLAEGNPNLKPERSTTGDIGIIYRPGPLYLAATGFTQSVTNLIQWSPNFAGVWRPLNVSSALIQGIELEGRLSAIRINSFLQAGGDGSYTYLDALDESGLPNLQGNQLIYRPHEKSSFGATLIFWKDFQFSFRSRFVGYRYTTPSDTSYIPGFITYQLGLKVSLATGFDVTTTVYNLTNVNYYDVNDYPMPGTQWEIKSSLAF